MEEVVILKALADNTRINIIKSISKNSRTVMDIAKRVGKSQPNVSIHLRILALNGILEAENRGRFRYYKLSNEKVLKILEILNARQ